jgi:ABC-type multidrug transport system ATPase subunit
LIVARAVSRRYGANVALQPCDFELRAGEVVALVGPNGAGKSTLLALLAGALAPSSGSVTRAVPTGWAPQRPAVYGKLTPRENLALFARLAGSDQRTDSSLPERPAAELSVGQRQRLNLELAFLGEPRALLLDEPTASLDDERRGELWERVERLRADGGAAAFATQLHEDADRADRVVHLDAGRVV